MGETSENKPKKHICIGLLAHVDAGKTTLSESILYLCGSIRKPGRVDHGDAFLDTYSLERSRGITIFSKQAVVKLGDICITLLDTPGHVDFSSEMERTLQVLDYAVLVISGADGVQGHTRTLWNLLKRYSIPVFLFINKMDQEGTDREKLLEELKSRLDEGCTAFDVRREELWEEASVCDENALEEYLENGSLKQDTIVGLIQDRKVFPCYFGSALKLQGVQEFLDGLKGYTKGIWQEKRGEKEPPFGGRVYKISRDARGERLTHIKLTSGSLRVKDILSQGSNSDGGWEEKVNQIRIYSGEKYETVKEVQAGEICAVTGLTRTYPGEGLGVKRDVISPVLEPVLNYCVNLPKGCDAHTMLMKLKQLEEEDPMLRIVWNEELQEIHVRLMGEVQTDILKSMIKERFGIEVSFDAGNIVYKETIQKTVEGVGHFEPLRHYAEVHLILEPQDAGSGLTVDTDCSEDMLDKNWQRLILTHLLEKTHRGVLIGAEATDLKITLAAGRAHLKHTEGGDFRQATYRAVRQGLMQADSMLLEPYYDFRLEVPSKMVGRALTDIQRMQGEFSSPETEGEMAVISGSAPVSTMRDYQMEVAGYTKGSGRLSCTFRGYAPCHNAEEIIRESGYDPERDIENPAGSVFCAHGAGFNVPWNEVSSYMHLESQLEKREKQSDVSAGNLAVSSGKIGTRRAEASFSREEEKELEEIFIRTYGKIERKSSKDTRKVMGGTLEKHRGKKEKLKEYLLVDGYNVIFAWEDLKDLAKVNIEAARNKLMDILCNYQGFKKCTVILVFDAYKVEGYVLEIQKYHNIHVVYTKEAETADQYIEKVVHEIGRKYHVTVVTSDGVEQVVTLGQGGKLISAREFHEEVETTKHLIREEYEKRRENGKNYLFDHMDKELAEEMEEVRLGRKEIKLKEK
ncbi:translation factor GTPase family protein [Lachnospiraceae bacterium 42-17]